MTGPSGLLAERRRLLEERRAALAQGNAPATTLSQASTALPPLTPRPLGAPVPMSFAHELLWMLETANPGMHGYNVSRALRMEGPLDVTALQRALDTLVRRHDVLRSTFDRVDGEPRQLVHPARPVHIEEVDLRQIEPADARERAAREVVEQLSRRPFDLANDLQLRTTLVRIGAQDQVILLESHHVASDAWSRNILYEELAALYEGFATGRDVQLPDLPLQYADFAVWQRHVLRGERLERLLSYWRAQLGDAPTELALPTDRPAGAAPSFKGTLVARILPRPLLDGLLALSREQGVTLFMTLLAAFDVLLARYSGQDDIVVGSPMAGRSVDGVERIMGYFADTLVLRTRLDGNPTFLELLSRVRRVALDAYEHQGIPYEKLVLELAETGRSLQAPLFRAMFTLHDAQQRPFRLHGLTPVPFQSDRGSTKFDLSLFTNERPDGLRTAIEYRTDLFDAATIDRLLDHFGTLLESIVRDPEQRIGDLALLTPEDENRILRAAAGPRVAVPAITLSEMIAAQCAATPDAVAVDGGEPAAPARLTFGELHARAGVLARALRTRGVGAGTGVGVCAERSPEMIIALVAVLAAGAHYVPLDPEYPRERLEFMLEDSGIDIVLATRRTAAELGEALAGGAAAPRTVLVIEESTDAITSPALDPPASVGPDDLAYVIYTSGSTGKPKGVRIPHRAVVNYLTWMRDAYGVGARDAILQKAPASFDASVWELFLPLVSGARLVLAPAAAPQDPEVLLAAVRRHGVSLLQLVPSQLRMLLEAGAVGADLASVRRLFLGGEALPAELLAQIQARCPTLAVTNLYGPTEATVYATHWDVEPGTWAPGDAVLIGTPIANARVHVIDGQGRLVPDGAAGEILIAGDGVAAGYLNRPELDAERFIPDPFGRAGAIAYRTGDRGRLRVDGGIEYLGRADGQVKLRGFRVELGEIESVLGRQPEVASAVAMIRDDGAGSQMLVAYCVAAPRWSAAERGALTRSVRERLRGALPAFMIPAAIVWLDAWPMNANGKLDRARLPAPTMAASAASEYVPPRTEVERAIAAAWAEVLGREQVGVTDDFFALGGHSLAALRISLRVHDLLGVRLPLATILERASVERLAEVAEAQRTTAAPTDGAIRRVARDAYRRARVSEGGSS